MPSPHSLFARPDTVPPPALTWRDWLGMAWRQLGLILLCTVVVGGFAAWLLAGQRAPYASSARVWVQTEQQGTPTFLSGIAALRDTAYPDPVNRKIETEMELMLTRSSAADVIRRLGIREDQLAVKPMEHVKGKIRSLLPKKAPPPASSSASSGVSDGLVELFLQSVKVAPLRSGTADTTSNVLEISFECVDAELAPKAVQALVENYLKLAAQQNRELGQSTARLIERQLGQALEELRTSEDNILALALRQAQRSDPVGGGATPSTRLATPSGMRMDMDLDVGGTSHAQAMTLLKTQQLELQAQLDQARQLYTEETENVKTLRERLGAVQARLRKGVGDGARVDVEMARLERQRSLAQDRFVELRKRLDQIELYLQLSPTETNSRTLIDRPTVPVADGSGARTSLILLGPLLGLMLGLLLAGVREFLDSRLRGAADVRRVLGLPLLGGLPQLPADGRQQLERGLG